MSEAKQRLRRCEQLTGDCESEFDNTRSRVQNLRGRSGAMGKSEIEQPVLIDVESQVNSRISRVNEDYVALPGAEEATQSKETWGSGSAPPRMNRSVILMVSICCIAAVLFLSAGFISYNLPSQSGGGLIANTQVTDGENDGENDFYKASHPGYHFQPEKNWMNDPNGPMFYKGYYHFFYQYNPDGPVFGLISWGHAVSTDLINWKHLEIALMPDQWYDNAGVWSGSATLLEDGTPVILYTGGRSDSDGIMIQCQCLASPVNPSDPLLRKWKKSDSNPILNHPDNVFKEDFRDPSTAWLEKDGFWRSVIGARVLGTQDGMGILYKSSDFLNWQMADNYLHEVPGSGMWECVDFYPISVQDKVVQNYSGLGAENYVDTDRYVMKASLAPYDYYTIGTYSTETDIFTPDDPALELGLGPRYDYGKFYASKTFYDSNTGRRILWAWVNESDSERDDIIKGWASLQTIPRTVRLDPKTSKNVLQWPIEEVEALRGVKQSHQNMQLLPTTVFKVEGGDGPQLDILAVFDKPDVTNMDTAPDAVEFDCSQGGSAHRGTFGPFGLLVHADDDLSEHTGVFFYISPQKNGEWATRVCSDQSRSSLAPGLDKTVYGSYVTVLPTENELALRILLDHSIVETFVQGGRLAITSRVYPTVALGSKSHLYLFNNGTKPILVKRLDVYQMGNVEMTTL